MHRWFIAISGGSILWRGRVFRILHLLFIWLVTHQQKSCFFWGVSFIVWCFCKSTYFNLPNRYWFMHSRSIVSWIIKKFSRFLLRAFWLKLSSFQRLIIDQFHPCWHGPNCFMRSFSALLLFCWLIGPWEHALNLIFELPCSRRDWREEAWGTLFALVRFRSEYWCLCFCWIC